MACFSSCGLNTLTSFDSFVALNGGCGSFSGSGCFSGCGSNSCGCNACCNPCCNPCGCPSGCQFTHVTLSGTVTGVGGAVAGMPIQYTVNGQTQTTTTNANGSYSIVVPVNSSVTIAPQPGLGVTVTPATRTVNVGCSGQTGLDFTLTPVVPPTTFTVSGTLTNGAGAPVQGSIQYTINGVTQVAVADAAGNYNFTAASGANVIIMPTPVVGSTVTPPARTLTNLAANTPGQNFVYTVL